MDGRSPGSADADSRLGPVLEAVINGRYYWVPFSRLTKIELEPPEDLRDMVWMPAHLQFENGGESVALIPTRYPGSETAEDGLIALARKTVWEEIAPDTHRGLGQRILTTDTDDVPAHGGPHHLAHRQHGRDDGPSPTIMAEQLLPQDRLQPALLDRLTDDEPDKKQEPREARVLSKSRMRQSVLRDLAWLFNATRLDAVDGSGEGAVRAPVGVEFRVAGAVREGGLLARCDRSHARDPRSHPELRAAHPAGHAGDQDAARGRRRSIITT